VKSVQHGFGPICWQKLNDTDYNERPASLRITITDQAEAQKSLAEIRELMKTVEKQTCRCGAQLDPANVEYYDHEGGYDLPGFGQPQWLYHHCEKCNFDYSLWKLGIQYAEIKYKGKVCEKLDINAVADPASAKCAECKNEGKTLCHAGEKMAGNCEYIPKRYAVVIIDTEKDSHGEYIPCIVKEGKSGYYPTTWKWGTDIDVAKKLADDYNEKLGISKEDAMQLTLKSMRVRRD